MIFISLITGHFRNLIYFTLIILIHELGHSLTAILLGLKLEKIEIYPYGGCSKLEYDINTPIIKELLVILMGPIIQIILMLIVYLLIEVPIYFYTYNMFILIFNLLPIYPLDGGKLLNIFLSYFLSYYQSLKKVIYFSYMIYISLFIIFLVYKWNLLLFLGIILLGIKLISEIKLMDYYFQRFLIERHINTYNFTKSKKISSFKQMRRDYYHFFIDKRKIIDEKKILAIYFNTKY